MPRGKATKGICTYCHKEVTRGTTLKHLAACEQRLAAVLSANAGPGPAGSFYYLRVWDAYTKAYWLDLEVGGSAKLKDVDKYLRAVWLECCGHLSEFTADGFGSRKAAMTRQVSEIFAEGDVWTHLYDFGDTSETLLQAVAVREGKSTTKHPIALLFRNAAPEEKCMDCAEPARWFCRECVSEHNRAGTLCDAHRKTHPHRDYGEPIRLVNSPRLGMCGYDGPAEPPY